MLFKSMIPLGLLGMAVAAPQEPTSSPATTTSKTLPPSPTASGVCVPHEDHWHCHPTSTGSAGAAATSAGDHDDHDHDRDHGDHDDHDHGDHDHDEHDHGHGHDDQHPKASGQACVPHKDHWHCPEGVPEPTTPPAGASATAKTSTSAGSAAATSSPKATSGADARAAPIGLAFTAASLVGALFVGTFLL
ncbi:hypothetical protein HIM_07677 [Hirsutella minnesotensis 3608]|uniref:Uncharacterized protein n=1 Tax=Hirsutella minnesotensis 3608 TaxID=1043627 RepID=A0A0F8A440_9HYPO|nr:hypothetical protein HIM_07677 [Hirsutella minnesotensis 3608]